MPNTYAGTWDADHEGHGGWTSEDILGNLNAPTWLGAYTPDVVFGSFRNQRCIWLRASF